MRLFENPKRREEVEVEEKILEEMINKKAGLETVRGELNYSDSISRRQRKVEQEVKKEMMNEGIFVDRVTTRMKYFYKRILFKILLLQSRFRHALARLKRIAGVQLEGRSSIVS